MAKKTEPTGCMINWDVTKHDALAIERIARRAQPFFPEGKYPLMLMEMDITATHLNGCELDLAQMESGEDRDLIHDVLGIYSHLDRKTGKLLDFFNPRYAVKQKATPKKKAKRHSGFRAGSGCFTCSICGKRTRDTGGDNGGCGLCEACYDAAGNENWHSDTGGLHGGTAPVPDCPTCKENEAAHLAGKHTNAVAWDCHLCRAALENGQVIGTVTNTTIGGDIVIEGDAQVIKRVENNAEGDYVWDRYEVRFPGDSQTVIRNIKSEHLRIVNPQFARDAFRPNKEA